MHELKLSSNKFYPLKVKKKSAFYVVDSASEWLYLKEIFHNEIRLQHNSGYQYYVVT